MSTHKHIEKLCLAALAVTLLLTILFLNAKNLGVQTVSAASGYENRLFRTSSVHTIDIIMDDWDSFIQTCTDEEYAPCTLIIDGEAYRNVAIRAKGNTSLTQVAAYGNDRYSFKVEFDHYDIAKNYYGLDKLCLNNIIQDNTYMKEFLTYQMMAQMGAPAPLCSYVDISVNGESWGLYLAIEGIEEAFLQRNYGNDYGCLYKPDSTEKGGNNPGVQSDMAPDNGQNGQFDMAPDNMPDGFSDMSPDSMPEERPDTGSGEGSDTRPSMTPGDMPDKLPDTTSGELPDAVPGSTPDELPDTTSGERSNRQLDRTFGDKMGGQSLMGNSDVLLQYTDDDPDSYSNIFDNAKTECSSQDKERLIEALKQLNDGVDLENTIDMDCVIRYFVVHNFVLNFDSYTGSIVHNYYLYEKDGQLSLLPWDYNLAFGGFEAAGGTEALINYPIDTPVSGGTVNDRPMLAWIFSDEDYTDLYHQYFSEFISDYFESGKFAETVDSVTALISPYVEKDPTKFCTYEEFLKGADTLKTFCLLRAESIRNQLEGNIGLTADAQNQETFIDPGTLELSDMGSMNQSGNKTVNKPDSIPENNSENGASDEVSQTLPEHSNGQEKQRNFQFSDEAALEARATAQIPSMANAAESAVGASALPLLLTGISALILLAGLIFALVYGRR